MTCADFAQFLRSFSTLRNFAQIFAITYIFAQEINLLQRQNFSGPGRRVTPLTRVFNILELLEITPICWLLNFAIRATLIY